MVVAIARSRKQKISFCAQRRTSRLAVIKKVIPELVSGSSTPPSVVYPIRSFPSVFTGNLPRTLFVVHFTGSMTFHFICAACGLNKHRALPFSDGTRQSMYAYFLSFLYELSLVSSLSRGAYLRHALPIKQRPFNKSRPKKAPPQ